MTNGHNNWGVRFSHIKWFERLLQTHGNVVNVNKHDDIVFETERRRQNDHIRIVCCNEYTMGLTAIQRGLHEFGSVNIFYIGGGWCGYTRQAKQYCLDHHIGLSVTDEALWRMTTGHITRERKKEIQSIITANQHDVLAVFGFGSYFRGEPYNDIDILVVLKPRCGPLLPTYYRLRSRLQGIDFGVPLDLTVLTSEEFDDRPLRDMHSLVEIG